MEGPSMERALSTDVVMDVVLSYLKVKDLLACRTVSKFWNQAASSVLRRRSTMIKNISEENQLMELQEDIEQNSDFPFAGLKFNTPWKFSSAGAMEFFKNYGERFTRLRLDTQWTIRLQDVAPFINRLPRLSILEMGGSNLVTPPAESSDSAAGQEDCKILSLPSLCTLRMFCRLTEDVLRGVCTAASPSLRIECPTTSYEILRALKNVGKLQAVSVLKVDAEGDEEDYALMVDELLSTDTPALTKLEFEAYGCISWKGLMKLLISSQHTLKELQLDGVCPSELLLECPVLAKLNKLSVSYEEECEYFFEGSHGHKFPALTELELCVDFEFLISDGLFVVPTVTRLDFNGVIGTDNMNMLAQTFPNVVAFGLHFDRYFYFEDLDQPGESILSEIWSVREFKQLERLRICGFYIRRSYKKYNNMDSFLTGIPLSFRQNMQNQKPELMVNLIQSPSVQSFSEVLRVNPNILQLKNLKELVICVQLEDRLEELPEDPPFMSMVSVWFALGMMPNLEAKFVYDHSWLSTKFTAENRDKAVTMLKAAFKHVQPHVKLEPFFY